MPVPIIGQAQGHKQTLPTPSPDRHLSPYTHSSKRTCSDCFWFNIDFKNMKIGACHQTRVQSSIMITPQGPAITMGFHPDVPADLSSCGDFKEREDRIE